MLHRDRCCRPARGIFIRLNPLVQVDHDRVAIAPDDVAVHVPRRATFRVKAVRLVLRIVFRALERGEKLLGLLTAENLSEFLMLRQISLIKNKGQTS